MTLLYEAMTQSFVDEGVEVVFCLMGDGNKHWLVDMAAQRGVRLVHARHEGAALAMADGYARAGAGDLVGVCAVTYGPGVTQLSTSLMVATKHGTPLVVFAADVPDGMRDSGGHLDIDERAVLEAAGASVREIRHPQRARDDVRLAFHDARVLGRPVALLVGVDVQEQSVGHGAASSGGPIAIPRGRVAPDPRAVDDAVDVLARAERPLILAGRGAMASDARELVVALAHRLGAVVATTFLAKGWLDEYPASVGIAGGFTLEESRGVIESADCVLALGASLNDHTTDHGRLFGTAAVVQVDLRPHALVRNQEGSDVYLRGDVSQTVGALLAALEQTGSAPGPWAGSIDPVALDPRSAHVASTPIDIEEGRVDPRRLMLALDRVLPDDALIVVGGGHFMAFAAQYLSNPGRRSFEMAFDFMTTGQAVPTAIGAAVARPDRMVVAIEGDASFLMHVQELETAARSGIPLLVMVMNDGALGAEYHNLRAHGLDPSEALAPTPDLARLGRALGGAGMRLDSLQQVDELMGWFEPSGGPHVVDCAISRRVVGPV
ncbi:MAG TPA: thiamine pyrophosphate-binding protein [Acidimicrobiales bacterium]|nr:thiamine pyrophosphate-binding protein [Acidimicrobiales bacterium]